MPNMSAAQLRAARALLGWSQQQLAATAGVGRRTIASFELGKEIKPASVALAREALEEAGIIFLGGDDYESVSLAKASAKMSNEPDEASGS